MNWPIWLFVLVMAGLVLGFITFRKAFFVPAIALVLYLGVEFSLWLALVVAFWALVALALIFVLATKRKPVLVLGVGALIVAIMAVSFGTWSWSGGNKSAKGTTTTTSSTAPPSSTSTTVQKTPNQCVEGYNVVLDQNQGNKVISAAETELPMDNPAQAVKVVMQYAQHDPRVLQLYWNSSPLGKKAPVEDWHTLVQEGCYTGHARDLYQQTLAQYESASTEKSTAPSQGVNTGVESGGGQPFQETPGAITGDLRAVKVTFLNGDVIYILHRCGNVVTSAPIPGVPVKPPPAPPSSTPPQHPVCPPGSATPGAPVPPSGVCPKKQLPLPPTPPGGGGPGRTPSGGTPPPPSEPVHGPTGCGNTACPRPTDAPPPAPTTTAPPQVTSPVTTPASGQDNNGTVPQR